MNQKRIIKRGLPVYNWSKFWSKLKLNQIVSFPHISCHTSYYHTMFRRKSLSTSLLSICAVFFAVVHYNSLRQRTPLTRSAWTHCSASSCRPFGSELRSPLRKHRCWWYHLHSSDDVIVVTLTHLTYHYHTNQILLTSLTDLEQSLVLILFHYSDLFRLSYPSDGSWRDGSK